MKAPQVNSTSTYKQHQQQHRHQLNTSTSTSTTSASNTTTSRSRRPTTQFCLLASLLSLLLLLAAAASSSLQLPAAAAAGLGPSSSSSSSSVAATVGQSPAKGIFKRSFAGLGCLGVYDKAKFARLDRVCEECYQLYREPDIHTACRQDCFRNSVFTRCVDALLLSHEQKKFDEMVDELYGK